MNPAPKRGEWGAGDVGAPTGAVHYKIFLYRPAFSGIINKVGDTGAATSAAKD